MGMSSGGKVVVEGEISSSKKKKQKKEGRVSTSASGKEANQELKTSLFTGRERNLEVCTVSKRGEDQHFPKSSAFFDHNISAKPEEDPSILGRPSTSKQEGGAAVHDSGVISP